MAATAGPIFLTSLAALSLSFCSQIMPLFIGNSWQTRGHKLWHKWWQHMSCTILSMVGAITIVAF
jgi:hypothetical protein